MSASKTSSGSSGIESKRTLSASSTAFRIAGAGPSIGQLADSLRAECPVNIAHLFEEHSNGRKVGGSWHDVVCHLAVLHAAILPNHFLVQRISDSLGNAACDLPAGQDRMQHLANFLQRHEIVDRHAVGRQINCHFRDVDRPGKGGVRFPAILVVIPEHIGRRFVACPRPELSVALQPDCGTRREILRRSTNRQAGRSPSKSA